ncbi:hypothetical protein Mapa_000599 [Marchantia paleacea]|nr:hypothetical protein Mapa_000599 [Marchantia paleacea]
MKLQQELDETDKSAFVEVPEVVSAQYVVSETLCLSVESNKHWSWCGDEITIENDHAQRPFTVESTGHGSILVRDISGNGLVFLEQQYLAFRRTWRVYLGEKCEKSSYLYTLKHTGRNNFSVFLATNTKRDKPDFTVKKERSRHRSFNVYYKDDDNKSIVEAKHVKGEKKMKVTIHPGVDLAFVATLIVLMDR